MKRERTLFFLCILAVLLAGMTVLSACGDRPPKKADYYIYYLNKEQTKILPVPYELQADKAEGRVRELMQELNENPDSVDFRRALAGNVGIPTWRLENGVLRLNFGSEYSQMDAVTEVLCRAAVVRTLIQVDGVDSIAFYVGDSPLMDVSGKPIGLMTAESFIENPGEQINSIQTATVTLYFSNKDGDGLVQEVQERHYNSNIPLEKLVMELLFKGPISKEGKSAIPGSAKLVSISVLDGVCFVTLDEGFLVPNNEVNEGVVIYSIVNSLVELPNVNKVQISVNGDTSITYREKFPLSTVYERNLDYVVNTEKKSE